MIVLLVLVCAIEELSVFVFLRASVRHSHAASSHEGSAQQTRTTNEQTQPTRTNETTKNTRKSNQNGAKSDPRSLWEDPGCLRGDLGRAGARPEHPGRRPGVAKARKRHPTRAKNDPQASQTSQKERPGVLETPFRSYLFGQSFARRSRSDSRTILGSLVEGATRNPLAMAHTDCMSGVFRRNARATPKTTENGAKTEPERSAERAVRSEKRGRATLRRRQSAQGPSKRAKSVESRSKTSEVERRAPQALEASRRNIRKDISIR